MSEFKRIVDVLTGEYYDIKPGQKIRVVDDRTEEYLKSLSDWKQKKEKVMHDKGYVRFEPNEHFTKIFDKEFEALSKEMSGTAMSLLILLLPYSRIGSNILYTHNNRKKVDKQYIIKRISPYSYNTTVGALEELKDLVAIVEASDVDGDKQYVMNPYLYFKGGYINKTILGLFNRYKKRTK